MTLIVASATSLYLERKRLFTLADGAALVGAESFELDAVAMTPDGPRATLTDAGVRDAVRDYLGVESDRQVRGPAPRRGDRPATAAAPR